MKKLLVLAFTALLLSPARAQEDTSLQGRLAVFMKVNNEMDLEKILDFTYPKLFTIAPRDQVLEAMEEAFDNEEVLIKMDSLNAYKVFPVFQMEGGNFARIEYSMRLLMTFKEAIDDTVTTLLHGNLASQYGMENVVYDKTKKQFTIRVNTSMVAVKDDLAKDWCFVNLKKEDPLMDMLFSKAVQEKLDTFK